MRARVLRLERRDDRAGQRAPEARRRRRERLAVLLALRREEGEGLAEGGREPVDRRQAGLDEELLQPEVAVSAGVQAPKPSTTPTSATRQLGPLVFSTRTAPSSR